MSPGSVVPLKAPPREAGGEAPYLHAPPDLATAVRSGLSGSPRTLPAALLYDELGSALFEAITLLPEYELTRADLRLLERHAREVGERLPGADVVELGPGAGRKAKVFLERFANARPLHFTAVDVSEGALRECQRAVGQLPGVQVTTRCARYLVGLRELSEARAGAAPLVVLFLGSNLSNFNRENAQRFIQGVASLLRPGDGFLLATDLDKPAAQLVPAYDDALGVTAAFNKNLLVRLNRELGADFDVGAFRHEARWSAEHRRIEMHLVATRPLDVHLSAMGERFHFDQGESIWTESSHRFRTGELQAWGAEAGFVTEAQWVDPQWAFAHTLYRLPPR